jgi:hypothetical protein
MHLGRLSASWSLVLALAVSMVLAPSLSPALAADPLQVQITTNQSDYARGQQAQLTLTVKNTATYPVVVTFSNGKKYDFTAFDASGAAVWTWSQGRVFDPIPSQQTLAPGASWTFSESWSFTTNLGQRLADGSYTLRGTFTGEYVGKAGPKTAEQTVTYFTPDYLQISFSADKNSYQRGEQATLTLTMTNTAPYPLTVSFATAQRYDFNAVDAHGNVVWTWSTGRIFEPIPGERTLAPGEAWVVQEVWNFRNDAGAKVPDGDYTVSGTLLGDYEGRSGTKSGSQVINLHTPDPIFVTFSTDKSTYRRLESAKLTLRVTNVATYPVTISFQNGQFYDFTATNSGGNTVWTWSRGKTFPPEPAEVVLAPDEAVEFTATWTLVDNNGFPVSDGTYTVSGIFLGDYLGKSGPKGGSSQIKVSTLP